MLTHGPSAEIVPLKGDTFRFECRPGLTCFGDCCSDLTLLLMPYDVVRLRRRLKMGSTEFLDRHTETMRDGESGVPRVQLKMGDDAGRRCPFLSAEGCTVYEDRPSACRMFPLGRAAAARSASTLCEAKVCATGAREQFFMVREEVCAGWAEAREWSVDQWLEDQGLRPYIPENDRWIGVFTRLPALANDPNAEQRFSVFRTAGYDLDRFRDLVTGEAFTSRFVIPEGLLGELRDNDEALLRFAVDWLSFALFGDRTIELATA